ncbi:MAG TPA: Ig-like domain-containing protein, partial [Planctomycetota bacterium]|nr:Ig-like domain-containing protein [Planctomycetota bacterium]
MKTIGGRRTRGAIVAALAAGMLAACGSGGGQSPKPAGAANLFVKSISVPNYNGVLLDEDIEYILSAPVSEDSINPDSIQMRTGAQGGTAPFGVFVRGEYYVDPITGTRVVVDPGQVSVSLINRVERGSAPLNAIPAAARIDLGMDQPDDSNGGRRLLFNRAKKHIVTFVPEIPTRAALDDTGFTPGSTYTVAIPGYPATNTLENLNGAQLLSPNSRVFTSTFTCVPTTAGNLFLGAESAGPPRVIHTDPFNGTGNIAVTTPINIRFSHPLDPRTVTPDKFKVELISVAPPYPQISCSVFLAQQRLGKIEVILTPVNPLPPDGAIR